MVNITSWLEAYQQAIGMAAGTESWWGTYFSQWSLKGWARLGKDFRYQKTCRSESIFSSSCSLLSYLDAGFHLYSPFMQGVVICECPLKNELLYFTQFWASVALHFHISLQKTESIHLHISMKQRLWTGSSARLLISTLPSLGDILHPSKLNLPNKCSQMETICSSIWDCKRNFH